MLEAAEYFEDYHSQIEGLQRWKHFCSKMEKLAASYQISKFAKQLGSEGRTKVANVMVSILVMALV